MKIGIQLEVAPNKVLTIESNEHQFVHECTFEIRRALGELQLDKNTDNVLTLFGAE